MYRNFLAILRLSPPDRPVMGGGDFHPLDKISLGGTDGGGLNSAGGGFFDDASGSRGSPPISDNPAVWSESFSWRWIWPLSLSGWEWPLDRRPSCRKLTLPLCFRAATRVDPTLPKSRNDTLDLTITLGILPILVSSVDFTTPFFLKITRKRDYIF